MPFGVDDIKNKKFDVVFFRGYSIPEVDNLLDTVCDEMEKLVLENADLKEKVAAMEAKLSHEEENRPLLDRIEQLERRIL